MWALKAVKTSNIILNKKLGYLKQRGAKSTHSRVCFILEKDVKYRFAVLKDLISIPRCWYWAWQQNLSKINWDISNALSSKICTSWFLEDCCRPRNLELWAGRLCFRSNMFCCIHKKIFSGIPAHQEFVKLLVLVWFCNPGVRQWGFLVSCEFGCFLAKAYLDPALNLHVQGTDTVSGIF